MKKKHNWEKEYREYIYVFAKGWSNDNGWIPLSFEDWKRHVESIEKE